GHVRMGLMSRLTLKPLDWQTDDEHLAAVHFSRVPLLGAIKVARRQPARGGESLSFAKNHLAGAVHDLNHAVGADATGVVQRPGQSFPRALYIAGCEPATGVVDSQSRLASRQTRGGP